MLVTADFQKIIPLSSKMLHKDSIGIIPRPLSILIYYTDSGELPHQSFVVISDCLKHDTTSQMEQHPNTKIARTSSIYATMRMILEFLLSGIFLQLLMVKVLVMDLVAQLNATLQELASRDHMKNK